MNKLSKLSRFVIAITSLFIIAVYFVPVWRIDLFAPQYPEGLVMKIWLTRLSGDVDVINGLNHYIGMGKIEEKMFPEFSFLTYAVAAYIMMALFTAFSGSRKLLYGYFGLTMVIAMLVLYDLYRWGYQYGHNLNPHAPIKVPGMAYQPPVLGHKRMLNFDAYSLPDIGGWIFVGFGVIVAMVGFFEWKASRRRAASVVSAVAALLFLSSCAGGFKQINYGKDECSSCKMIIMNNKFAAEILSVKGRTFKFDDIICARRYIDQGKIDIQDVSDMFVNQYDKPGEFIKFYDSFLVRNEWFKSPMGGNLGAFANKESSVRFILTYGGTSVAPSQYIIKPE